MPTPPEFECAYCGKRAERPPFGSEQFIPYGWVTVSRSEVRPTDPGGTFGPGWVQASMIWYFCSQAHKEQWLEQHPDVRGEEEDDA